MINDDLYKKTKVLLKQLNYFIIHVLVFMLFNALLVSAFFNRSTNSRWWVLSFVVFWAVALIYHGMRLNGVDPFNRKNKRTKLLWSLVLKLSGI
ncbi:2TM domain-containing protein [Fulvivirga sp. M361]|uniref:2TM domain-containing protein n=1 Tax=Fulvivirga sp. M361 TaxID=2594266 RepID=UPI00117B3F45|nr:2TM domain-containing protein [Fulvivirga sp. M361]